jgi:hypothetical protein
MATCKKCNFIEELSLPSRELLIKVLLLKNSTEHLCTYCLIEESFKAFAETQGFSSDDNEALIKKVTIKQLAELLDKALESVSCES